MRSWVWGFNRDNSKLTVSLTCFGSVHEFTCLKALGIIVQHHTIAHVQKVITHLKHFNDASKQINCLIYKMLMPSK